MPSPPPQNPDAPTLANRVRRRFGWVRTALDDVGAGPYELCVLAYISLATALFLATLSALLVTGEAEQASLPRSPGEFLVRFLLSFALLLPAFLFGLLLLTILLGLLVRCLERFLEWLMGRPADRIATFRRHRRDLRRLRSGLRVCPLSPSGVLDWVVLLQRFRHRVITRRPGDGPVGRPGKLVQRLEREQARLEGYVNGERLLCDVYAVLHRHASPADRAAGTGMVFFSYTGPLKDPFLQTAFTALRAGAPSDTTWLTDWDPAPRLLLAPRWAHAALSTLLTSEAVALRSTIPLTDPVETRGVDPFEVVTLWDPRGSGPFRDIREVVHALAAL